jgi:hypothetical protein
VVICPTKGTGAEIPGTGLQIEGGEGPGLPRPKKKSHLEPNRDGKNMMTSKGESIPDVMKEEQQPTE